MPLPSNIPKDAGRPPALVRFDLKDDILDALEDGGTYEMAAKKCGITATTLFAYLRKGRKARELKEEGKEEELGAWDPYYLDLVNAIDEKEAEIQAELLSDIRQDPSWTSKAWILERRYGWTKDQTVRHEGFDGGPMKTEVTVTLDLGDKTDDIEEARGNERENLREADWEFLEEFDD